MLDFFNGARARGWVQLYYELRAGSATWEGRKIECEEVVVVSIQEVTLYHAPMSYFSLPLIPWQYSHKSSERDIEYKRRVDR
jgi:hypothetical protein